MPAWWDLIKINSVVCYCCYSCDKFQYFKIFFLWFDLWFFFNFSCIKIKSLYFLHIFFWIAREKVFSSLCSTNSSSESPSMEQKHPISCVHYCAGCSKPIKNRYFLKINQSNWHEGCVVCCVCKQVLVGQCYVRKGNIYCHQHYTR